MRAAVAMGALVDHEGAGRDLDLVRAEVEEHVHIALRHRLGVQAPLARHEAEIERADAGGGGVQDREAVPAILHRADVASELRRGREHREAVGTGERALPHDDQRTLGGLRAFR